jgi:hypothetical protein
LALTALMAHSTGEKMGNYLDIARQSLKLLVTPIPAATGSNPEAGRPAVAAPCADDDGGRCADWVRRPDSDGRTGWETPDLPEAVDVEDLPLPGPGCPVCGSLEQWQDALGRQRCGGCEADALGRALKLVERAARLRRQAQQRKPAARIAPGCVPGGSVDTQDLGSKRPTQGRLRGLCGM